MSKTITVIHGPTGSGKSVYANRLSEATGGRPVELPRSAVMVVDGDTIVEFVHTEDVDIIGGSVT